MHAFKNAIAAAAVVAVASSAASAVTITQFNFPGNNGQVNQLTPTIQAANTSASDIQFTNITNVSTTDFALRVNGFPSTSGLTDFFFFSVEADPGFVIDYDSVSVIYRQQGTPPDATVTLAAGTDPTFSAGTFEIVDTIAITNVGFGAESTLSGSVSLATTGAPTYFAVFVSDVDSGTPGQPVYRFDTFAVEGEVLVPEPATASALLLGLGTLAMRRRR